MDYSCFHGLVGLRFDERYDIPRADASATEYLFSSKSGLWVNDLAPNLINLENVQLAAREYIDIENFLIDLYHGAISEVINGFETFRATHNHARRLLSNNQSRPIVTKAGAYHHKVSKSGRLVGLEIRPKNFNTIALTIQRLGFQFDSVQPGLPMKLYRSDSFEPVLEFNLTGNAANTVSWFESNLFTGPTGGDNPVLKLDNANDEVYYLCYYEDDLQGYAIKKDFSWKSCGCAGYDAYTTWDKYFSVQGFFVSPSGLDDNRKLFDIEKVSYESINYGLNFSPYVECDLFSLYCDQKMMFASAMQHKIAIKILQSIWSSRDPNQANMSDMGKRAGDMAAELTDKLEGMYENGKLTKPGIMQQINLDFSGLDSVCTPERSRWGVATLVR